MTKGKPSNKGNSRSKVTNTTVGAKQVIIFHAKGTQLSTPVYYRST
jgi:hypothetical protein